MLCYVICNENLFPVINKLFQYLRIKMTHSLRSWRYCVGARLKFWRRSRDGSAIKSHSTTTQYRQLRRLDDTLHEKVVEFIAIHLNP